MTAYSASPRLIPRLPPISSGVAASASWAVASNSCWLARSASAFVKAARVSSTRLKYLWNSLRRFSPPAEGCCVGSLALDSLAQGGNQSLGFFYSILLCLDGFLAAPLQCLRFTNTGPAFCEDRQFTVWTRVLRKIEHDEAAIGDCFGYEGSVCRTLRGFTLGRGEFSRRRHVRENQVPQRQWPRTRGVSRSLQIVSGVRVSSTPTVRTPGRMSLDTASVRPVPDSVSTLCPDAGVWAPAGAAGFGAA